MQTNRFFIHIDTKKHLFCDYLINSVGESVFVDDSEYILMRIGKTVYKYGNYTGLELPI